MKPIQNNLDFIFFQIKSNLKMTLPKDFLIFKINNLVKDLKNLKSKKDLKKFKEKYQIGGN